MLCFSGFELYSRWLPLFLRRGRGYDDLIFNSLRLFIWPIDFDWFRKWNKIELNRSILLDNRTNC